MVPEPVGDYHGLFLELKNGSNKPSVDQDRLLIAFRQRGYAAFWCNSFEDAEHLINIYLKGKLKWESA